MKTFAVVFVLLCTGCAHSSAADAKPWAGQYRTARDAYKQAAAAVTGDKASFDSRQASFGQALKGLDGLKAPDAVSASAFVDLSFCGEELTLLRRELDDLDRDPRSTQPASVAKLSALAKDDAGKVGRCAANGHI